MILKNKNFLLIYFSFLLIFGGLRAFSTGFTFLIKPFGVTDSVKISYLEVSPLPFGLIFSSFLFHFLKNKPDYKKAYIFCNFLIVISFILFYFSLESESFVFQICSLALFGMGSLAYIPLFLEWAQEESFPAAESTIVGIMIAGA
jgi:Na+/melibiose symporter-like transporter